MVNQYNKNQGAKTGNLRAVSPVRPEDVGKSTYDLHKLAEARALGRLKKDGITDPRLSDKPFTYDDACNYSQRLSTMQVLCYRELCNEENNAKTVSKPQADSQTQGWRSYKDE